MLHAMIRPMLIVAGETQDTAALPWLITDAGARAPGPVASGAAGLRGSPAPRQSARRTRAHRRPTGLAPEGLRRDIRRIASTVFCGPGIDPSIVSFAMHRTALHWGLSEDEVDLLVTARLLRKSASLMTDLRWIGADPAPDLLDDRPGRVVTAA